MLKTVEQVKTSDKIKKALDLGFTASAVAKVLNISRPTYYKKMAANDWSNSEIITLRERGIIR